MTTTAGPTNITAEELHQLAGSAVFERGKTYAEGGHVQELRCSARAATATVAGTDDYRVRIEVEDDDWTATCDCPHAADGFLCKHVVAVGLSWLDVGGPSPVVPNGVQPSASEPGNLDRRLRSALPRLRKQELIELDRRARRRR